MLRCALILVETSDDKIPQPATMGAVGSVLQHEGPHDGHVPRNVRVALVTLDTVEPYTHPLYTNGDRSDELHVLTISQGDLLVSSVVDARGNSDKILKTPLNVTFDVGGGFTVEKHGLTVLRVESMADADALHSAARGQGSSFVRGSAGARQTRRAQAQPSAASPAVLEWVDFVRGTKTTASILGSTRALRATASGAHLLSGPAATMRVADVVVPGLANTRWGKQGRAAPEVESSEDLETSAFHPRFTLGADVQVAAGSKTAPCAVHLFAALPWATVDTGFSKLYDKLVTPAKTLPQAHISRVRGSGQYTAAVTVPAEDAVDGKKVEWKVRGQYQAVAPPQLVAVLVGDASVPVSQCKLYSQAAEAAASPGAAPGASPSQVAAATPTSAAGIAASVSPAPEKDNASPAASPSAAAAVPSPPGKSASDQMKEDASGIGVKLVLGVLGGVIIVVVGVVVFAKWRARAQEQRYRQAHAAAGGVGGPPPSAYSDGGARGGMSAGPPDTLQSNGGVAEVVLSPDLGPAAPQGGLTPFDTDHDSDSTEGDLDRLISSPGVVASGPLANLDEEDDALDLPPASVV